MFSPPRKAPRLVLCSLLGWNRQCVNARGIIRHARVPWPVFAKALTCAGRPQAHGMNFMSDKCFVDTNILVYAHDRSAGVKHQRAQMVLERLWDSGQGVLSTQVLQELCINLRRKISHALPVDEVRRLIRDYATWEVVTNTSESVLHALDIELRYKTSFWDALILQAAESSGASILYSEDLATGQRYRAVQVVNPLIQPMGTQ